jgi:hypothetical protein
MVRLGFVQAILLVFAIGDISAHADGQRQADGSSKSSSPPPYQITQDFKGTFSATGLFDSSCTESSYRKRKLRCQTFTLPLSPHRLISAELTWDSTSGKSDTKTQLGFEIMREGRFLIVASQKPSSGLRAARMAPADIPGNRPIEIRVLMLEQGDGPVRFELKTRRSNLHTSPYVPPEQRDVSPNDRDGGVKRHGSGGRGSRPR